jgi:hypothetical protein
MIKEPQVTVLRSSGTFKRGLGLRGFLGNCKWSEFSLLWGRVSYRDNGC